MCTASTSGTRGAGQGFAAAKRIRIEPQINADTRRAAGNDEFVRRRAQGTADDFAVAFHRGKVRRVRWSPGVRGKGIGDSKDEVVLGLRLQQPRPGTPQEGLRFGMSNYSHASIFNGGLRIGNRTLGALGVLGGSIIVLISLFVL